MRTKIFTVHENVAIAEPSERVMLVREGFSLWAFAFTVFWLVMHRLWLEALGFMLLLGMAAYVVQSYGFGEEGQGLVQLFLTVMLGFAAHDLERAALARRGYRMTGVVAAESELAAERRFYDTVRV